MPGILLFSRNRCSAGFSERNAGAGELYKEARLDTSYHDQGSERLCRACRILLNLIASREKKPFPNSPFLIVSLSGVYGRLADPLR